MKKNLSTLIGIASSLFILSGCKTTVPISNGEVPNSYLEHAKKAAGIYHGKFNGVTGDLTISFSENRPLISFKNINGSDILNSNCKSKIGQLREVDVIGDAENLRITSAVFSFDPGQCYDSIDGRVLRIDFKEKNGIMSLKTSIVEQAANPQLCQSWGDPTSGYGGFTLTYRKGYGFSHAYLPRGECKNANIDKYLIGSFIR